jgi:hypothetical protein
MEDGADGDNPKSKSNLHEAQLVVEICRYLLLQGYGARQLVVLTPYLGQLMLLLRAMRRDLADVTSFSDAFADEADEQELAREAAKDPAIAAALKGLNASKKPGESDTSVRVSTIDNYQGEEADVVIVSLVRGNRHGQIGFLKEPQRVNVMLSRARHGLILVGHLQTLQQSKQGKSIWQPLLQRLAKEGRIMAGLPTRCQHHPDDALLMKDPTEFRRSRPNGGCSLKCSARMPCGHSCPLRCHPFDPKHVLIQCFEPCRRIPRLCPDSHPCPKVRCSGYKQLLFRACVSSFGAFLAGCLRTV